MAALLTEELEEKSRQSRRFYASSEWRKIRKQVLERDRYTCQLCGKQGREHGSRKSDQLIVHHKTERVLGGTDDLSNLETLCPTCHLVRHGEYSQWI